MKPVCLTQFLACLLWNRLVSLVFTACLTVFPAEMLPTHTAQNWETSRLDRKCPSQVCYVYDRPVCFQVQSVSVHRLSGGGVLVLKQNRTRQDVNCVGQDGKCNQQAIDIHGSTVSRWAEPQSRCKSWRVVKISNMFDILPIHSNKLGNYNGP